MKLKKLGMALVVILALGAIAVSSASAAAVTEDQTWTIEGVTLSGSESVSSTGNGTLATTVGATPLELTATGINCLSCTISNSGGSAVGAGSLELTGVRVRTPSVCTAKSVGGTVGIIKTNALELKADYMILATNYILFKPVGTSTVLAEVELLKGSGSCPISGKYKVTGEVFFKSVNATGVDALTQEVISSGFINEDGSGKTNALQFGGVTAALTSTAYFNLAGAKLNKKFGTH